MIILPDYVARRIARENQKAADDEAQDKRQAKVEALHEKIAAVSFPRVGRGVGSPAHALCEALVNNRWTHVLDGPIAPQDLGRLLATALFGPDWDCEVKTA